MQKSYITPLSRRCQTRPRSAQPACRPAGLPDRRAESPRPPLARGADSWRRLPPRQQTSSARWSPVTKYFLAKYLNLMEVLKPSILLYGI